MATLAPPTALITGGAGFIGSHLTERLLERKWRVVILDDFSTGSKANLAGVVGEPGLVVQAGSVADVDVLRRIARDADVIVHLAAAVGVQLIIDEPVRTIQTNVRGTECVLEAALKTGARVIVASSSEVYGKGLRYPFRETDDVVLGSTDKSRWAYAATKMVDEFLCFAFHSERALQAIPIRLFNTVGARQTGRYGMVIPRLVRQALRGEELTVYGDGTQRRCFCDVRDVVRAIVGLIESTDTPVQAYNIGSTEETTILGLAERVLSIAGANSPIRLVPYDVAYPAGFEDMQRRVPDTTRINGLLGWTPQFNLDQIIESVVDYERQALEIGGSR